MSELGRVALAFLLTLPITIYAPGVSAHAWSRATAALALFAFTLVPGSPPLAVYVLALIATVLVATQKDAPRLLFPALAVTVAAALLFTSAEEAWEAVDSLASNGDVLIVAAGWALTVFAGGALVGLTVPVMLAGPSSRPAARDASIDPGDVGPETPEGSPGAGRAIGWLERSLIFAFVLGGMPEAAAIVFAAKSIARFASLDERPFAEYYLIGSLASVAVALGGALLTAAALGASAF